MVARASKRSISVTWLGHSAFRMESPGGKILLTDPWLENPKAPSGAKEIDTVDIILISHGHSDHLGNTVEIAKRTNAKVACIFEVSLYLQSQGVQNVNGFGKGGTIELDGIKLTMTDAKHSGDIDIDGAVASGGGDAAGYVIEFENGYKVYFAGDTTVFSDMKIIGDLYKPDVALLPIGGFYTMGPREAAYACKLLKPKTIVGMHYGTFPILAGTPAELRKYLPAAMKKRVQELEIGAAASLS